VGFPRSGTTLLRALLGNHPQLRLFNEPGLIFAMMRAGYHPGEPISPAERATFLARLREIGLARRHLDELQAEVIDAFLQAGEPLQFREAYERLLPVPEDGTAIWGEKSLNNVFYLRELHALYPDALTIHIVRDPRATLLSYFHKRVQRDSHAEIVRDRANIRFFAFQAMKWRLWQEEVGRAKAGIAPAGFLEIRYEDLVVEPEREIRRCCAALGVAYHPDTMNAEKRRDDPALRPESAFAHRMLSGPIKAERAKAANQIPDWAAYAIGRLSGGAASRAGYPAAGGEASLVSRVRVELELARAWPRMKRRLRETLTDRRDPPSSPSILD
jgi:hypothetical protein